MNLDSYKNLRKSSLHWWLCYEVKKSLAPEKYFLVVLCCPKS